MFRIFELLYLDGSKIWFTGKTLIHGLNNFINTEDCHLADLKDCEILEIPSDKWGNYFVEYENEQRMSFTKWMDEYGKIHAHIMAGTMFYTG